MSKKTSSLISYLLPQNTKRQRYYNLILRSILPQNTKRRGYYDWVLQYTGILINNGFQVFFSGILNYKKNKIRKSLLPKFNLYDETLTIKQSDFLPLNDTKIAVHVHVYYIDLFEEISNYLKNIPLNYSLYISVTNDEHQTIVLEKIKELPFVEHAEVRVVKNRGRDIAPFIVEFGQIMKNYDYICHIHTKKSVYTGEEKAGWRQYSYERLLGSTDIIKAILTAFKKDPSIGVIYPEIYPSLPYWACTWLSNKHIAPGILDKLKIPFDPEVYFDYPVGSMFWIQKESLNPILDLGLKINDFPEELGQTDGTLQHTLERCFVLVAQSQGFRHLVIRDPIRRFFAYKSDRNLHQYFDSSFENQFMNQLKFLNVISFDIFDTLLIRPFATPNMVFNYLEEIVYKQYNISQFKELRIKAESIARERKNYLGDVKISEIYSVFSEITKVDLKTTEKLLNLEVNTEKELLIPRKEVIDSAKYAKNQGKRLILVSDTYFERKNIEDILSSKGIDFFDDYYLSCETGKRKDRGDLWDYIFECEDINPSNFMHIGDNEQSDVQKISDKGYNKLIHIMRPSILFRQSSLGLRLWDYLVPDAGWRENLLYGKIANSLCSNPNKKQLINYKPFEDPYIFGYNVFGPIIFNFMNWLIKTIKNDKCQQLWFLSREGYLLNEIFKTIVMYPNLTTVNENFPNNNYFLCSRRAAIFASLETEEDLHQLLKGHFKGSLRDLFTKRLSVSTISQIEDQLGSEILNEQINLINDYDSIFELIKRVKDILLAEAETERELLLQYCNTQGFERSKQVSVVDVGYSGTIQYALAKLLNHPIGGYYFITSTDASKLFSLGCKCKAYYGEFINWPPPENLPIYKYSLLLESVLTSPTGQIIRFEKDNSIGLSPVFKEGGLSQKEYYRISKIHNGILKFFTEMYDEFGPMALEIEFPKNLVQICYELVIKESISIGSLKSILSVEDEYSGNDELYPVDFYKHIFR